MARKALIEKAMKTPKYSTRLRNRCRLCGRPRGFIRIFLMCRLCFRKHALEGVLPGVKKASW
jgi:small subunit ribosomal protein S14